MVTYALQSVNQMPLSDFLAAFGDIAEHSPWVAERAAVGRPYSSKGEMVKAFSDVLMSATREHQLALIRAHPDLGGKAAMARDLTDDSQREQAGAGLDSLTQSEYEHFTALNKRYREKFEFPFIFAVKGASKHQIIDGFEKRILNDESIEYQMALENISRIFSFRIEERVT